MGPRHALAAALLALGLTVGLATASAHAQDADAQATATARALFNEGIQFVEAHDWHNAVDRFRRVYQLRPNGAVRLNLGLALAHDGHVIEGTELLHQAAIDADTTGTVRRQAVAAIPELEAKIGRLTIHADGVGEGTDVTLDGAPLPAASIGVAGPADPGTHTVTLVRAGATVATTTVEVPDGGAAEATLRPGLAVPPDAGGATEGGATTAPSGGGGHGVLGEWWFWTAVGGGVLLTTIIVIAAVVASGGTPTPISGNTDPPFLNVMVTP
jgi:hypothetical protein